ncbi:hypothetical protein EG329_012952 [Mollisiaceae sp. DMI_Dod_QoI]|nr:hypothetical protein EG329_012952 [Helotiales sp. DMI_Dod_QoI]
MARVTRSKKIEIAEDHTALAIQTPLPDTPAKQTEPLAEIHNTMGSNKLSMDDDSIASEVKGLKAAYKAAIGVAKRGKKSKAKQKGKHTSEEEDTLLDAVVEQSGHAGDSPVPEATRILLQSREGSLRSLLENAPFQQSLTQTSEPAVFSKEQQIVRPAPAARTTRGQLAKAQAGQYNLSELFGPQDRSVMTQKLRDIDFISLFGGRSTGPSRTFKNSILPLGTPHNQTAANHYLSLAEDVVVQQRVVVENTKNDNVVSIVQVEATSDSRDSITEQATANTHSISNASQSPVRTLAEVERVYGREDSPMPADDAGEDSFVQQITSRSPAKPVSRIEDSVEALDQLEEALDALDQAALAERMVSPEKNRQQRPIPLDEKAMIDKRVQTSNSTKNQAKKSGAATMRAKSTAPRPSVIKKATSMTFNNSPTQLSRSSSVQLKTQPKAKAPIKRPLSLMPPKETSKSTKPPTRPTFELPGEAVARKLKEQREARLAQRESSEDSIPATRVVSQPKIKSTKPPTKSTFELPGEALSRKKREAHEARLKAQEEEERKRREFKARPIRNSVVPDFVPRETVASRARQSKVGIENMGNDEFSVSKRGSNVGAHRPSILELSRANTSAPRAKVTPPVRKPTPTTHGPSMSGRAMQRTVSTTDVQIQRQRAREIYNRDAKLAEDMERDKRDREAAAKRAREEAAERGRQASREWAEKQMARKLAEGDKGMSAGYGPGGQMGLGS